MKLYEVIIDNDPGGWKSGTDSKILVIANSKSDAVEMVRNKEWGEGWHVSGPESFQAYGYIDKLINVTEPYMSNNVQLRAREVRFPGFVINPNTERGDKLNKILGDD